MEVVRKHEPRCESCAWWRRPMIPDGSEPRGSCARLHDSSGLTHGSKAVAVDDHGMFASLLTAPDFGCIQWEGIDED
jgi:hypothetical protein